MHRQRSENVYTEVREGSSGVKISCKGGIEVINGDDLSDLRTPSGEWATRDVRPVDHDPDVSTFMAALCCTARRSQSDCN